MLVKSASCIREKLAQRKSSRNEKSSLLLFEFVNTHPLDCPLNGELVFFGNFCYLFYGKRISISKLAALLNLCAAPPLIPYPLSLVPFIHNRLSSQIDGARPWGLSYEKAGTRAGGHRLPITKAIAVIALCESGVKCVPTTDHRPPTTDHYDDSILVVSEAAAKCALTTDHRLPTTYPRPRSHFRHS